MISVIVPVYNVELYLRKCLDSIVNQTYRDLEILVIDDGSTDGSGIICDEYGKKDSRIKVFHTENKGLSAARNLGIDKSTGEYIGFVDSDDWIEPNMYEKAISYIGLADILCFSKFEGIYTGFEALICLINGEISTVTWNKIYRRSCFSIIRFPEGRIIEDISTTYMLVHQSERVVCADIRGYHHILRKTSLCQVHNLKNIFDYCLAVKEQNDYCMKVLKNSADLLTIQQMKEIRINLLQFHAYAIARAWGWRYANPRVYSDEWERMSYEARTIFPFYIRRHFPLRIRCGLFLARFNHPCSFWIAHKAHVLTRTLVLSKKKVFDKHIILRHQYISFICKYTISYPKIF